MLQLLFELFAVLLLLAVRRSRPHDAEVHSRDHSNKGQHQTDHSSHAVLHVVPIKRVWLIVLTEFGHRYSYSACEGYGDWVPTDSFSIVPVDLSKR